MGDQDMKRTIGTVAITFLVTSALWHLGTGLRKSFEVTWLLSAVKAPGRMALYVVYNDLQAGNLELAKAHLEVLRESWARFEGEEGYVGNGIGNIMVEFRDMPMP
jgi:hypothetical protein